MKTIVSVTPLPVSADSRTFKIAASFARMGYRSIVVEGEKSGLDSARLPFELSSVGGFFSTGDGTPSAEYKASRECRGSLKAQLKQWMKRQPTKVEKFLRTPIAPLYYIIHYFLRPLSAIPNSSLYYLHAPYQFPAVCWSAMRWEAPIIYDAHDFYSDESSNIFYKILERWCIGKAGAVVTVSEGIARLMKKEFGCQAVVLRNCHDARLERIPSQDLRKALELPPDNFLLVTVGQPKPGQAIDEALEALVGLPNKVHLAFLGKNTNNHLELVRRFGLESRVHLVPPVKQDEVVPFIRSADAALILYYPLSPQYESCLPNGFFQSVSSELPLLYPELPEIKKIAQEYELGIPLDSQSPESIRKAIERLMNEPDTVSELKKNLGKARLALSWEQEEKALYDLVTWVMRRPESK